MYRFLARSTGGKSLEGWEIFRIRGIPLRVHPSWFLILVVFTWLSKGQLTTAPGLVMLPLWQSWGLGFISALLLFLSVLLHELGHSFVAINEGVKVRSITLFLLGGVANVERECSTPMATLRVAAAGPLVSFFLAIILLKGVQAASGYSPLLANLLGQLGSLNLILALFNLLPGLPLDGGIILKALVWHLTGSQRKGVQVATNSGRCLAFFSIGYGAFSLLAKNGGYGALWLILIGWFALAASRSQTQMLTLQNSLTELRVEKAFGRRFRVLEEDQTLRKLSKLRLSSSNEELVPEWVLVCNAGRWVGYVTDQPLKDLPVQYWDQHLLSEYIKPLSELPSIAQNEPLWKAIKLIEGSKEGRLLVFNSAGLPSGTLDRIDVGKAVLLHLGFRIPSSMEQSARNKNTYPLDIALPQVVESMISSGMVESEGTFDSRQ